ncbi:MAG: glutamate racemase [Acidobacteriaceae bacterium]|nr:glutamate racemase [Acidobacteriaceae bacterium]
MPASRPVIGVFDSGFGGLTVLKALLELIPDADFLYFGDTARLPYGSKSPETVANYAIQATQYLEKRGARWLVIACNTATALALGKIKGASSVPVVGVIEPGADYAADASKNKRVAVIATEGTVASHAYLKALNNRGLEVREKACPLLVPLIEEGWLSHSVTEQVARIYLEDIFSDGFESADVLVLGCTHYPLIKPLLQKLVPAHVSIVDSAKSTAHAVRDLLLSAPPATGSSPAKISQASDIEFFVTDSVEKFERLGPAFLGRAVQHVQHVDLEKK